MGTLNDMTGPAILCILLVATSCLSMQLKQYFGFVQDKDIWPTWIYRNVSFTRKPHVRTIQSTVKAEHKSWQNSIHTSYLRINQANSEPCAYNSSQPRNVGMNSYSSLNVQENAEMIKGTAKALSKQTLHVTLATRGGITRHS